MPGGDQTGGSRRGKTAGPAADRGEGTPRDLHTYRRKRRFDRTTEPPGPAAGTPRDGGGEPCFVVQVHDASTLHFDFRLEVEGVLKSWSVPKGPPFDPRQKRLAVPTEDHPLEYRTFEGVIAEGQYGAGTVLVWDQGTYQARTHDRRGRPVPLGRALERGHASFWLHGSKLRGGWALTRTRGGPAGRDRESWLLVKVDDEKAGRRPTPDPARVRSARTGRTLGQVAREAWADEG